MRSWLAACCLLCGCAVGPDYERPDLGMPETHRGDPAAPVSDGLPQWQEVFTDETLQALIAAGLEANIDLAVARSRLREAEADLTRARAPLFPSFAIGADGEREYESILTGGPGETEDTYTFLGLLAWEIDLWGFNRRRAEAFAADLASAGWTVNDLQVSVIGAIAATYFNLVAVREQLALVESTVVTREQTLRIQKLRNESGVISGLEVAQAKLSLAEVDHAVPGLENRGLIFENQLRRLLGEPPDAVATVRKLKDIPLVAEIPPGLPADLLERRPDVRIAELGLVATNAEVGVAKADLFPRITLTGEFGRESADLADLLESDGKAWIANLSVTQPVFNAGARRAALTAAWARRDQAAMRYTDAVLRALEDVSNAIDAVNRSRELAESTLRLRDAAAEYLKLAFARYNNGVIGYIDVLDAQRQYFDAEFSLIDATRDRHLAVAQLYRALGGGWQSPPDTP